MDKITSHKIVRETFQNPFQKERFVYFIKNLLNKIEEAPFIYRGNYIPDAYEEYISTLERVGKYSDGERKIDILIVNLKKTTSIERARTMQRNFIAWYLNGSRGGEMKDAALVAFVSPNQDDWRFSLVKMDYKFEEGKKGKMKVKEEFTPAKRWSFLVGKNEISHTAQSRLAPIVTDDEHNPTLKQLEEAFNIEKVTKEFFEKYRELFLWTKETLEEVINKDIKIKNDFNDKNISSVDFAKKLLGQIVFLYFLQKKGWFGVPMSKNWGEGDKKFLRSLFIEANKKGYNYFNDYLEPLFYEALAKERDEDFYSRFKCKIPFLNGGLFDPISSYDWVNTTIDLPDELFSNTHKTKEGDIGNGILDIFDRYNFTVKEDEPLEKEVAVDPEMLGKVFENLLEVKDRKSKGTYYTPREIVHYMCQQSLINYLKTETKIDEEKIERVVKQDILLTKDEFLAWQKENHKPRNKALALWEGEWEQLDNALEKIRIVDPACGSGAFLVGMLNEIIRSRKLLQLYSKQTESLYTLKERTIKNCIYGVDIDPSAVEIAKLRLWLSLVVDEEDIKQIKPLPNLDYKIMQGNSLLEEFEGINLFDEKLLQAPIIGVRILEPDNQRIISLQNKLLKFYEKNPQWMQKKNTTKPKEVLDLENQLRSLLKRQKHITKNSAEQKDLFTSISKSWQIRQELERLHKRFFGESVKRTKDDIKRQIEKLEWDLIEATLKEQKKIPALKKLEQFKKSNTKPFFLWKLHFADVFQEKGGFDVVIANPPYFQLQKNKKVSEELSRQSYRTFSKSSDIYCIFYEKGILLLKNKGILTYISSNSWLQTKYGVLLRRYLVENTNPLILINFENSQLFDTAIVETNVLILQKGTFIHNFKALNFNIGSQEFHGIDNYFKKNYISIDDFDGNGWIIGKKEHTFIRTKMEHDAVRLKDLKQKIYIGILNGYNDAFIIDSQTKEKLIKEDPKSVEIIKPILRGRDVGKYNYVWQNQWLINSHNGIKNKIPRVDVEKDYPAIYRHLQKFEKQLRIRLNKGDDWTNLRSCGYLQEFEKPKIIWGELSDRPKFAYDERGFYAEATLFALVGDNLKYLLGILNSRLGSWYFDQISTSSGMGTSRWKKYKIELLPIKDPDKINASEIVSLVDRIINITQSVEYITNTEKQAKVREIEHQIDGLVYKLYELTGEEIKIIEGS